jgi:hypothetical protein
MNTNFLRFCRATTYFVIVSYVEILLISIPGMLFGVNIFPISSPVVVVFTLSLVSLAKSKSYQEVDPKRSEFFAMAPIVMFFVFGIYNHLFNIGLERTIIFYNLLLLYALSVFIIPMFILRAIQCFRGEKTSSV